MIAWDAKLRHLLQTLAFCLAVATLQYAFTPHRPYAAPLAYSLAIGVITWSVVDLGRHAFPSSAETGWPHGAAGILLVIGGIATGALLGTQLADMLCRTFGWYGDMPPPEGTHWRHALLISAMAGVVGCYYFYSRSRSDYLQRKMSEAQRHASEARLKLLEAQLEPHMLFNTLANLRALIGVDAARAQQMLDVMIAYLRATLVASRSATHPLQTEFDRIRDYLELMRIRMGPRLAFELDLPTALATVAVPTLVLQPIVENSIKHALEPSIGGGRITVRARQDDGHLLLIVVDEIASPLEVTATEQTAVTGFGLNHVRERLANLYGPDASFHFARSSQGSEATLRLPLP